MYLNWICKKKKKKNLKIIQEFTFLQNETFQILDYCAINSKKTWFFLKQNHVWWSVDAKFYIKTGLSSMSKKKKIGLSNRTARKKAMAITFGPWLRFFFFLINEKKTEKTLYFSWQTRLCIKEKRLRSPEGFKKIVWSFYEKKIKKTS